MAIRERMPDDSSVAPMARRVLSVRKARLIYSVFAVVASALTVSSYAWLSHSAALFPAFVTLVMVYRIWRPLTND